MSTESKWKHDGVRVVHSNELDINTPQTPGMNRAAAITHARAGAEKLWAGTVVIHPKAKTGAHHHGPVESVIYVVSGKARMRWGGIARAAWLSGDVTSMPSFTRSGRPSVSFCSRPPAGRTSTALRVSSAIGIAARF